MKCPECVKEGKKSRVYQGATTSTLLHHESAWDEDGNFLPTSNNQVTQSYSCSNGHRFMGQR